MTLLLPYQHSHLQCLKKRKDTLSEALTGAAVAFAHKLTGSQLGVPQQSHAQSDSTIPGPGVFQSSNTIMPCPGVSPGSGPPNEKL